MDYRWRPDLIRMNAYLFTAATLLTLVATVESAHAEVLNFKLNTEFSGGDEPAGTPPWLTATFDDEGNVGSVKLTLTANLVGSEFATKWDFNLDPSLDPDSLQFAFDSKTGTFADPEITTDIDAFMAGGSGRYDIEFLFDNSPPVNRFGLNESISYLITGIPTLTAGSFNFLSTNQGGHGPFMTAAHIQGVGEKAKGSGWVTVPEPSSIMLAAIGAAALIGSAARLRRNGASSASRT